MELIQAEETSISEPQKVMAEGNAVLHVLAAAAFLIFFQAYLVAPLIPSLTAEFKASERMVGLLVPAYMLPYGLSTLVYGPLSDRIGRRKILITMLAGLVVTLLGNASAHSPVQLLIWRIFAGLASGGVIPISLALLGDLFPYEQRGRPLGWIFGAIAGGMAFGSTLGAMLNPVIGWRMEFVLVAVAMAVVLFFALRHGTALDGQRSDHPPGIGVTISGYLALIANPRARRTYIYIFINSMFHSGLFTWLGLYFASRYGLGDRGIGLALLGYGIPGLLLGPTIGHAADRIGRNKIIPAGLFLAALVGAALIPHTSIWLAAIAVTLLSLGYDMTHPLLAGIITSVDAARRGQAMGWNAFFIFTGFGLGSLIFQALLRLGFPAALGAFAFGQCLIAILALQVFRSEKSQAVID